MQVVQHNIKMEITK